MLHVAAHQQHGLSYDAAVKTTATAELASPSTLRAAADQFQTTGTLAAAEDGRSKPKHPFYRGEDGPSLAAQLLIHHRLLQVSENNIFESCALLCTELAGEIGVVVSKSTMHRWLHALGYSYGKKLFSNQPSAYRNALIRGFVYTVREGVEEAGRWHSNHRLHRRELHPRPPLFGEVLVQPAVERRTTSEATTRASASSSCTP